MVAGSRPIDTTDPTLIYVTNTEVHADPTRWSREMLTFAACCTVAMIFVGVIGNVLTMVAFCRERKLRSTAAAFIASLCVSDLVFCLTVLPFAVSRFIHDSWQAGDFACQIVPVLRYGNVGVSLLSIAMISISRWLLVEKPAWYAQIYTNLRTAGFIAFCWILAYGLQMPALLGKWGKIGYDETLKTCSILRDSAGRSPKTALFIIGFAIPCVIIVTSYARIYWRVRASHARLQRHANNDSSAVHISTSDAQRRRGEWRVTRMVLAIFICFLVCYLPITLVKTLDQKVKHPNLHIAGYLLLYASSCLNPLIYVTMNKQYRRAYVRALACGRPSTDNGPTTVNGDRGRSVTPKRNNVSGNPGIRTKIAPVSIKKQNSEPDPGTLQDTAISVVMYTSQPNVDRSPALEQKNYIA